jgi:flagellar hook-basal body complex protein FliE
MGRRSIAETEAVFAACSCEILAQALVFWQSDVACASIVLAQQAYGVGCSHRRNGMNIGAIDGGRIEAMIAQLKAASTKPGMEVPGAGAGQGVGGPGGVAKVDFADALKNSIGEVSDAQAKAGAMGKAFQMGDDSVSLSDVMIAMQKASIGFQASIQVRNKLVSAYHEIMNMQV